MIISDKMKEVLHEVRDELAGNDFEGAYNIVDGISMDENDNSIIPDFIYILTACGIDVIAEYKNLGYVPACAYLNTFVPPAFIQHGNDIIQGKDILTLPKEITGVGFEAFENAQVPEVVDLRGIYVSRYGLGYNEDLNALIIDEQTQLEEDSLRECHQIQTLYISDGVDENLIKKDISEVAVYPYNHLEIVRY